ncbi:hypothetical protein IV203_011322 [Nitzschia inconspicua]|uniref:Uncharacterized protein n=1 Tax=Nitzschia inconspicua TaxID=303405 RepID=A0A9K3KRW6_9STRA|nr:hypothetical protein IV203_011322 [Nitzschia inconspicua]
MNCGSVTFTVDIRPSPHRNITTRPRLDIPNCVYRFCWIVNHDLVLKTAPGRMCSGLVYPRTGPKVDSQYVWSSWSWHRKLFGTLSTCLLRLAEPRYQPQRKNAVPQKETRSMNPGPHHYKSHKFCANRLLNLLQTRLRLSNLTRHLEHEMLGVEPFITILIYITRPHVKAAAEMCA